MSLGTLWRLGGTLRERDREFEEARMRRIVREELAAIEAERDAMARAVYRSKLRVAAEAEIKASGKTP